jgi:dCTP deaminase
VEYSSEKYQNNRDIQPSLLYKELNPHGERDDPQRLFDFGR